MLIFANKLNNEMQCVACLVIKTCESLLVQTILRSLIHVHVNNTYIRLDLSWPLFHKTSKTSLHRLAGLCKDVFVFYETEARTCAQTCSICSKFATTPVNIIAQIFVIPICCVHFRKPRPSRTYRSTYMDRGSDLVYQPVTLQEKL